ncbi:MAG: hypothetical protein AABZ47_06650 [Planctomycetota bacterium]
MANPDSFDILNELLLEEQKSSVPRIVESAVFISTAGVGEFVLLKKLADSSKQNVRLLTEQIIEIGESPWPRNHDVASADLHFQNLHSVLPRLRADLNRLIRLYQFASTKLSGSPAASKLISRILDRHRTDLNAIGS